MASANPAAAARRISPSLLFAGFPESPRERALLITQAAFLVVMTATVVTKVWTDHLWFAVGLTAVTAVVWSPELRLRRERTWWFAYVAGIFVYTLLRSLADETFIPVRHEYVIDFDRTVFFGTDPVQWLQGEFFDPFKLDALDYLSVATHWSFFIAPHALAVGIFLFRRDLFPRYTVVVVSTMWLALLLFFVLPTTPPWLAGESGLLPGVSRVMDAVGGDLSGDAYNSLSASLGEPNSVAAMPSLHMGITFAMYLWARDHAPRWAPSLLAYSLVMGFALMYLGEHYFADLMGGVVCASACWLLARSRMPLVSPVDE